MVVNVEIAIRTEMIILIVNFFFDSFKNPNAKIKHRPTWRLGRQFVGLSSFLVYSNIKVVIELPEESGKSSLGYVTGKSKKTKQDRRLTKQKEYKVLFICVKSL